MQDIEPTTADLEKPKPHVMLKDITQPAWSQQPDEKDLWYARFLYYLSLGPTRSVSLASTGLRNAYPLPSHWSIIAKDWRWRERGASYDAAVREGVIKPVEPDLDAAKLKHRI